MLVTFKPSFKHNLMHMPSLNLIPYLFRNIYYTKSKRLQFLESLLHNIIQYTHTGNLPDTFPVNEDAYLFDFICTYGIKYLLERLLWHKMMNYWDKTSLVVCEYLLSNYLNNSKQKTN